MRKLFLILMLLILPIQARATVLSTTNQVTYTGDGTTFSFSVPFKVLTAPDLIVKVNGIIQVLTTNYTVALLTNSATVNFVTPPPNTQSVVIQRNIQYTQPISLRSQGFFTPSSIENALDRLEMQVQQLFNQVPPLPILGSFASATSTPALTASNTSTGPGITTSSVSGLGLQVTGGGMTVSGISTFNNPVGIGSTPGATAELDVTTLVGSTSSKFGPAANIGTIYSTISGLGFNAYHNGTNWIYGVTGTAGFIARDVSGGIDLYAAPSGTGGAVATPSLILNTTPTGVVTNQPLMIGSTGTPISASYGATYNFAAGALSAGTCANTSQTLTGVSVGGACNVSPDGELGGGGHVAITSYCYVSASNTVNIVVCNGSASSFTSNAGNYLVRVFQP